MQQDLRMQLQIARTGQYGDIMRTTIFAQLGLSALIAFGGPSIALPLAIAVVMVALFGALGGGTALDDISVLRDDMDEATGTSNYGRLVKARNLGLLKILTMVLIGAIAVAQLVAILA